MEYLFKALFGKAAAAGISAALAFSPPAILKKKNTIIVIGHLKGTVTPKVERIIKTGTKVMVKYYVSVTAHNKNGNLILTKSFIHTLQFSPLKGLYYLNCSGKKYTCKSLDAAEKILGEFKTNLYFKNIDAEKFDFYAEAEIDYDASLEIDFSRQALWDYYIPSKTIKGISQEVIQ